MKNRYPGVNFFTKNDKAIFCGRKEDAAKFFTQVMLSKTLVLHAESGIGKSSLIQAGFIPLLDEYQQIFDKTGQSKYIPIIMRFDFLKKNILQNDSNLKSEYEILIEGTINKIIESVPDLKEIKLPYIKDNAEKLWHIAKKLSKKKLKLILIFDQFEELQNYDDKTIKYFKKELSELLSTEIPKSIYDEIIEKTSTIISDEKIDDKIKEEFNSNIHFLEATLDAKAVFVIRADKLGTMSKLSDYFPDILKNEFFLDSLSIANAKIALIEPANAIGEFNSPNFTFKSEKLVDDLVAEISDNQTDRVDPIQIQIVATTIEKNIIKKQLADVANKIPVESRKYIVMDEDIPPIGDIIREFYDKCWESIKEKKILNDIDFESKKNKILSVLVVNDRRDLVNSGWLIEEQTKETDELIVTELLNSGLIRLVPFSNNNKFYQLCHDRFIKPVADDFLKYEDNRKTIELKLKLKQEEERSEELNALNKNLKERTEELNKLNRDLEKQTFELNTLNKNLGELNEDLKEQSDVINSTNEKLNIANIKANRRSKIALGGIVVSLLSLIIAIVFVIKSNREREQKNKVLKALAQVYMKKGEDFLNNKKLDQISQNDLNDLYYISWSYAKGLEIFQKDLPEYKNDSLYIEISKKLTKIDSIISKIEKK